LEGAMPTKRRKVAPKLIAIPPEAIDAWTAGDWHKLHDSLGLTACSISPFDADRTTPEVAEEWAADGLVYFESHPRALELREALIEIAGEPGETERERRR
jgi:hypothetical protein